MPDLLLRSVAGQLRERLVSDTLPGHPARSKPSAVLLSAGLLATLPVFVAVPELLPLAVPIALLLRTLYKAKEGMTAAIAQLAMECPQQWECQT